MEKENVTFINHWGVKMMEAEHMHTPAIWDSLEINEVPLVKKTHTHATTTTTTKELHFILKNLPMNVKHISGIWLTLSPAQQIHSSVILIPFHS